LRNAVGGDVTDMADTVADVLFARLRKCGVEDTWGIVKEGIKQKAQQYLPGEKD
jgi:hypothetical protein